jgi:hypothetical protein
MPVRSGRTRHRCFVGRDRLPRRCRSDAAGGGYLRVALLGDDRAGVAVPEMDLPRPGGLDRPRAALFAVAAAVGLGLTVGPAGLAAPELARVGAAAAAAAALAWLAGGGDDTALSPGRTLTRWLIGIEAAAFVALALHAPPLATGTAALCGLLPIELLATVRRRQEAVESLGRWPAESRRSATGGSSKR